MSKSLDRLTLLATFARIAERGSISGAANDLGMAQASASRQLAALEQQLGVQLIQRTTHSLALTEAGAAALVEARALLDGWDALVERFIEDERELSGGLKIVVPVALGQLYLADAVLRFQAAHPKVSITWLLDDAPIRFAEIGCDLWIKAGKPDDDTLVVHEIGRVERLVVAAPKLTDGLQISHPSKLSALPCAALGPFEGAAISLSGPKGTRALIEAQVAVGTNNIFSAYQAAIMGIGYAVMPRWFVESDLASGRLVDVLPAWRAATLTITASFLPAARQKRRLRALLDHMKHAIVQIPGIQATTDPRT